MIRTFNASYRPQIESGAYKVQTATGKPVRIVCWDMKTQFGDPILAVITDTENGKEREYTCNYREDGLYVGNNDNYLVIDDGEPEKVLDLDGVKIITKMRFVSWDEEGETATALVGPDGEFFYAAINCKRDGDMGEKGPDGVWDRVWWGDSIHCAEVSNVRPATVREARLWLRHCGRPACTSSETAVPVTVVFGDEPFVIFEDK